MNGPVVALTGTPATGKTTVAEILRSKGHVVLDLKRFVGDPRFDQGADDAREGTTIVDDEALDDYLQEHLLEELDAEGDGPVFIESHFAHALTLVDRVVVLRCRPSILQKRLAERGYNEQKIRENMEVEGTDLILQEAVQMRDMLKEQGRQVAIAQIDTSGMDPQTVAGLVMEMAVAPSANLEIGRVDWSDEVLGWY